MKKPKITQGEWENYEDSVRVFQNPESRGYIEICEIEQDWDDSRANAKAISAVPEMIEALIEQEDIMQSLRNGYHVPNERLQDAWKQVFFALQKAGVE